MDSKVINPTRKVGDIPGIYPVILAYYSFNILDNHATAHTDDRPKRGRGDLGR